MICLHNHDQILEFLRKIFLKGFQIYQNYLCALSVNTYCIVLCHMSNKLKIISSCQYSVHYFSFPHLLDNYTHKKKTVCHKICVLKMCQICLPRFCLCFLLVHVCILFGCQAVMALLDSKDILVKSPKTFIKCFTAWWTRLDEVI